ncbi:MAG: DUF1800 domain-containing protein [Acidimicrobiales bacterium]|nr:DUF1800 domain-containing protein [Acidimicrobiales bacterium]MCB9393051.1 DUF1800 domain-containing protein [Acidimicrobiaceae bacterium]
MSVTTASWNREETRVADLADITHLLRRTEFVAKPARVSELTALSIDAAVDDVLDVARNGSPTVPGSLAVHDPDRGWYQYVDAVTWWLEAMRTRPRPIQEKMALFWHGHFTSSWWNSVNRSDHMMRQNQLYRTQGLGNFRSLTQAMAIEPAMLVYLNNNENHKRSPNQNFARELMELFTLGVGNYTEDDVVAAARAWTGHNADWPAYEYHFFPSRHDTGSKTFFGTTKNWDGPDIIDEILRDNLAKKTVAARFITTKLWEFFAHPGIPAGVLDDLSAEFLATDLDLLALMRALLKRPEFYSTTAKQGLVRSPVEWMVALCHHAGVAPEDFGASWLGERMGQSLFNPPNVAGWKSNASWLNTSALSGRAQAARSVTWHLRDQDGWAHLNDLSVPAAVNAVADLFGLHPLSPTTRTALESAHQAERSAQSWKSWWAPTNLLTMAMLAPEMHMA